MRKIEIAALIVLSITAITLYNYESSNEETEQSHSFQLWMIKYNKKYTQQEQAFRLTTYIQNLAYVKAHNERHVKGLETYDLEMNAFADLTSEEFAAKYLINMEGYKATGKCTGSQAPTNNIPDEVDWEPKGSVTPVKNQGQCGSCWAFSTTGSLEGAHYNQNKVLKSFSEQQLVDCSTSYGNAGCGGGWMNQSFFYVVDNGITLESKYGYAGVNQKCKYNSSMEEWRIKDCVEVTADKEVSLMASVALNPVSVAIQANHLSFQLYKSGVYTGNCGTSLDHGVLAVGYGTISGKKHFKVKNSWGSSWGSKGYIYIERTGDGKGKCGIQMAASYPVA